MLDSVLKIFLVILEVVKKVFSKCEIFLGLPVAFDLKGIKGTAPLANG